MAVAIVGAFSWWAWQRDASGDDANDTSAPVALDTPIQLDPEVRTDTLANGLRYYIRANDFPEERAELRLVVDAGSVLEDDDQRGFAHVVEHMAFRGTRRFPARAIAAYLESDAGLQATRDLLDMVLQERIREQVGGTYGVSVDFETRHTPPSSFAFSIEFTASPDRVDSLATATLAEIERLRVHGPTDEEATKLRKSAVLHNDESQGNRYWASELNWHSLVGWSLESIANHVNDAENISRATLKAACARYLDGRRFLRVTRLPEQQPTKEPGRTTR